MFKEKKSPPLRLMESQLIILMMIFMIIVVIIIFLTTHFWSFTPTLNCSIKNWSSYTLSKVAIFKRANQGACNTFILAPAVT